MAQHKIMLSLIVAKLGKKEVYPFQAQNSNWSDLIFCVWAMYEVKWWNWLNVTHLLLITTQKGKNRYLKPVPDDKVQLSYHFLCIVMTFYWICYVKKIEALFMMKIFVLDFKSKMMASKNLLRHEFIELFIRVLRKLAFEASNFALSYKFEVAASFSVLVDAFGHFNQGIVVARRVCAHRLHRQVMA